MADEPNPTDRAGRWWQTTRGVLWVMLVLLAPILFVGLAIDGLDAAIDRAEILDAFRFAALVAATVPVVAAALIGTAVHWIRNSALGREGSGASRRRRRFVFGGVCLLLWVGAIVVVAEIGFRLAYQARLKADEVGTYADLDRRKVAEAFHPVLWQGIWKAYRPGAKVAHTNGLVIYETSINSLGFRGNEEDVPSDDDFVIACLGGSTTVNGRTNDETYPAWLERYLRADGWDVRVINCGVSSMKSEDYGVVMTNLLRGVTPDVVLEFNVVNDICVSLIPRWQEELGVVSSTLLRSQLVKDLFGSAFVPGEASVKADLRGYTLANLQALAAQLPDVPLFVSSFVCPDVDTADPRYRDLDFEIRHWWTSEYFSFRAYQRMVGIYNELIRTEATSRGFVYVPLAEAMQAEPDDFVDICHLTPGGIEKKARAMAEVLVSEMRKHPIGRRLPRITERTPSIGATD